MTDVRDAVAKVRADLPQGILEPLVQRQDVGWRRRSPITRVSTTSMSPQELSWFDRQYDHQAPVGRARRGAGIAHAAASTGEIRVELDPARLAGPGAYGGRGQSSSCGDLNLDAAGGRAQVGGGEQAIRVLGGAKSPRQLWRHADHRYPAASSCGLSEIADVHDGVAELRTLRGSMAVPRPHSAFTRPRALRMSARAKAVAGRTRQDPERESGAAFRQVSSPPCDHTMRPTIRPWKR